MLTLCGPYPQVFNCLLYDVIHNPCTGIVLFALFQSILINQSFLSAYKIGMHCRITLSAAIYQKILSLSQVTIGRLSIGHIVNLASNDVHRLDMVIYLLSSKILCWAHQRFESSYYFVYVCSFPGVHLHTHHLDSSHHTRHCHLLCLC